jgi:uncharacterized protein yabE
MKNKINYISIFLMFFGTILVISSLFLKNSNNSFSINFKTSEYFKNNDRVTKEVKNIEEIKKYGRDNILKFNGTITSYGADCEGCSGYLSCPPHINAKNTIYYSDKKYKNLRIIAADKNIPCGSIVKIKGIKNYKDIYAIVLDRGGAIKGTLFDLLLDKEKSANSIGRQVVKYEILRWGWNNES